MSCTRASDEENFGVAQMGEKRAARGAYEVLPNKTSRDKEQTKKTEKKWQEVQQVWKKTLGWHRREKKERQGASEESP